jgi:hypothetical protein
VQPHAPPAAAAPAEPFDALLPLAGAAKTDSCTVLRVLSHFGHATTVLLLITMLSYRSPQSSQTYSYMGISRSSLDIIMIMRPDSAARKT